jgi:hypothetical protein
VVRYGKQLAVFCDSHPISAARTLLDLEGVRRDQLEISSFHSLVPRHQTPNALVSPALALRTRQIINEYLVVCVPDRQGEEEEGEGKGKAKTTTVVCHVPPPIALGI